MRIITLASCMAVLLVSVARAEASETPVPTSGPRETFPEGKPDAGPQPESQTPSSLTPPDSPAKPDDTEQKTEDPPAKKPVTIPEVIIVPEKVKREKDEGLFVLSPRAIGYRVMLERLHVGSGSSRGTKIKLERHLDIDNQIFLSPEINSELNWELFGVPARLLLSYTSSTFHGLSKLTKEIAFSDTVFPVDTVVGSVFEMRFARIRYVQGLFRFPEVEADFILGADYIYFSSRLDAPGFARESDVTEAGLPVPGFRAVWVAFPWGRPFLRMEGFGWNLGSELGSAGLFEGAAGVRIDFTRHWGFTLEFSLRYVRLREGGRFGVEIDFLEYGPALSLYASI